MYILHNFIEIEVVKYIAAHMTQKILHVKYRINVKDVDIGKIKKAVNKAIK